MTGKTMCPLCYRDVIVDALGRMAQHNHTPLLAGAVCAGGGRTNEEAKADAIAAIRAWRERQKQKAK